MFLILVAVFLAVILVCATAAALYLGIFRAGSERAGLARKALSGLASGLLSLVIWGLLYSHRYLGW